MSTQADDPRVAVLMQADLMAAPSGTRIPEGDNSWRDYALRLLAKLDEVDPMREVTGETSDGLHTFGELYRFRLLYNAALFSHWAQHDPYAEFFGTVHKSWRHYDGEECFDGGWFIVMATLPTGQISNHYEAADWDLFQVPERERADEWDGHTAADVERRLTSFLATPYTEQETTK